MATRKGTAKLDELLRIERDMQSYWNGKKLFEADAANVENGQKFFTTFPYPYMNGRLHLGHAFSLMKCEFSVGFARLNGMVTLWPFGFHCTGTPIKASADKLTRECEQYGCPPIFPNDGLEGNQEFSGDIEVGNDPAKSKKSKASAKSGNFKFQWQIMESLGLSSSEIAHFRDPSYWLNYFPQKTVEDLKSLGIKVDWRRSFITTDANPFYDSFVRWQFLRLKQLNKVQFGKRYTIFSPKDNQPCMDHERSVGEGVGSQEYTVIKLMIISALPARLSSVIRKDETVCLAAATLRPETVYGQTNCWLHPDIEYVAVRSVRESCILLCTERSAMNMAYQGILYPDAPGKIVIVDRMKGSELFGLKVKAPLSVYTDGVYILPMMSIKENKGTGVVISVPSDSPDDLAVLRDLLNKPTLRQKYGISDEMVMPFKPIEIIETPGFGRMAALSVVDELKIKSQNDTELLLEAKEKVYRASFYGGTMLIGDYKGSSSQLARKNLQKDLIAEGHALIYHEPERTVISRSGDEAVVALCDQWYLNYGEEEWKKLTTKALEQMTITDEVRRGFEATLDWLHEHACSRTYGLGSHLPWDERWLIESLSDSTIYMSYYTVAHLLQPNDLSGNEPGPYGIRPEHMTPEVWDYVLLGKGDPGRIIAQQRDSSLTLSLLERMRQEFLFWYPVDLRCSGKDLISNHFTYYLYNHTAIWPNEPHLWPRSVFANGHLLLNSAKMSKSTGNFLTLGDAVKKYSADGVRLALADAGDSLDDANVQEDMAEAGLLRLYNLLDWITQTLKNIGSSESETIFRTGPERTHADLVFKNDMIRTIELATKFYAAHQYKEVVKVVFYEFQAYRDRYREVSEGSVHRELICEYILLQTVLLSPICSHVCEHIWLNLLHEDKSIFQSNWPKVPHPVDDLLTLEGRYVDEAAHQFRLQLSRHSCKASKTPKPAPSSNSSGEIAPLDATVWVVKEYPKWQSLILQVIRDHLSEDQHTLPDNAVLAHALRPHLSQMGKMAKRAMPFVQLVRERFDTRGVRALQPELEIDEYDVLQKNKAYLISTLGLRAPEGLKIRYTTDTTEARILDAVSPLNPIIEFHAPPPSVPMQFINPDIGSGLFSLYNVPVCDGDSPTELASRVLSVCNISMAASRELRSLVFYRFVNPESDPFRIPPYPVECLRVIDPSDRFMVDPKTSSVMLNASGTPVSVGDRLIYRAG